MLACSGVTTALDLAGPVDEVLSIATRHGVGLTLGCLERLAPGHNLSSSAPTRPELTKAINHAKAQGACGVKVLGGHFPLTSEATRDAIITANEANTWIAVHCGTTSARSDLEGLRELLDLRGRLPVHIAHVNSYCRGTQAPPLVEAQRAVEMLEGADGVFSESYIARINATWGDCSEGIPLSDRTRAALIAGGFRPTEVGLEDAIAQGYGQVHVLDGQSVRLLAGSPAVDVFRTARTHVALSFPVNDLSVCIAIAVARKRDQKFAVDAWATDGGGIPRNNALETGYALVRLGLLTVADFVEKAAAGPARAFGLARKGNLRPGADADLAIVDPMTGQVKLTIARGNVIVREGVVFPHPTSWMALPEGRASIRASGLEFVPVDPRPKLATMRSPTVAKSSADS
jgi:hypothetical protein